MSETSRAYAEEVAEKAAAQIVVDLDLIREEQESALEALLWAIDEPLPKMDDPRMILTAREAVLQIVDRAIAIDKLHREQTS